MLIKELTAKECQQVLSRLSFGRLGCVRGGQPYVVPIYFAYEPDHIYGFSTLGCKIEYMRSNPLVCVEVDDVTNRTTWTSVIVTGRYEELPDTPEFNSERQHAQQLLERKYLWWQTAYAAEQLRIKHKPSSPIFYCIHFEEMTGRRSIPDAVEAAFLKTLKKPAHRAKDK